MQPLFFNLTWWAYVICKTKEFGTQIQPLFSNLNWWSYVINKIKEFFNIYFPIWIDGLRVCMDEWN